MRVHEKEYLTASLRSVCVILLLLAPAATNAGGVSAAQTARPSNFALKDGDRVVFFGDSITEQRLYTTYVEHYVLTRYPDRRITFINAGWGGDQVTSNDCAPCAGVGGMRRLQRDVIDRRPTIVTLLFGMNDGHYQEFDPALLRVYEEGMSAIIRELKARTRARIYVMTPTVYDGTRHTPWSKTDRYNEVLDRYSEAARQLAMREGLAVIDLHAVTTDALRRAKALDPAYTFLPDGVHPEADGQLVMAAEILRAWGAPEQGTQTTVRPPSPSVDHHLQLSVTAPLPWPQPPPSEKMRDARPQVAAMGRASLRIEGLTPGTYRVSIDDADAGESTAAQLAAGVSLSTHSAAASAASAETAALLRQRADLSFTRWRQIEVPFAGHYAGAARAVSAVDALTDEMTRRARELGRPHPYAVVITRIR